MSSLFDCFFGFIFWGVAYFRMRQADTKAGVLGHIGIGRYFQDVLNLIFIAIGIFFLTVGTYASVDSIILQFQAGAVAGVFSCVSNGI